MPFIDIAFQAEISRYEDPEFEEFARRTCDEPPGGARNQALLELRKLVDDGDFKVRRTDDAYLLRFLRARRFVPQRAYRLMRRYEDFRKKNAYLYKDVDPFNLKSPGAIFEGVIPDSPDNGRVYIINFGKWDASTSPIEEVTKVTVVMNEMLVMQPKLQILGATIIIDLEGLSLKQVRCFTPTIANHMVSLMGVAFPIHVRGIHIINYSWLINTALYVFKPLVPAVAWHIIHFHGSSIDSLQQYIKPCYLPKKYNGNCQYVVSVDTYLSKINKYKDEFLVDELKALGYDVK